MVAEVLQDGHLCPQLALVFVRKSQLVNQLHCHRAACVPVLACREGGREGERERERETADVFLCMQY